MQLKGDLEICSSKLLEICRYALHYYCMWPKNKCDYYSQLLANSGMYPVACEVDMGMNVPLKDFFFFLLPSELLIDSQSPLVFCWMYSCLYLNE